MTFWDASAIVPLLVEESSSKALAARRTAVPPGPAATVRDTARRLLRVHPLRTADALQLAAAFEAAEGRPSGTALLTFDERLRNVALREGFDVPAIG